MQNYLHFKCTPSGWPRRPNVRRNQQKELIGEVNIRADNDIVEKERNERVRTEDDETVAADSDERY